MNKRPYHIKDEEHYNKLVETTKRLSKRDKKYWTVIWSKDFNCWWMTFMKYDGTRLMDKM